MIKINYSLKDLPCKLYHKDRGFIGWIYNEHQFNDVRIQIKQQGLHDDYYILFREQKINFLPDGDMDNWIEGFYDITNNQYKQLYGF